MAERLKRDRKRIINVSEAENAKLKLLERRMGKPLSEIVRDLPDHYAKAQDNSIWILAARAVQEMEALFKMELTGREPSLTGARQMVVQDVSIVAGWLKQQLEAGRVSLVPDPDGTHVVYIDDEMVPDPRVWANQARHDYYEGQRAEADAAGRDVLAEQFANIRDEYRALVEAAQA